MTRERIRSLLGAFGILCLIFAAMIALMMILSSCDHRIVTCRDGSVTAGPRAGSTFCDSHGGVAR